MKNMNIGAFNRTKKITKERYQAALLGLAVGDALGATTENMWVQDIEYQYGVLRDIVGGGWLKLKAGQVTDDTDMTLATVQGILDVGDCYCLMDHVTKQSIGERFVQWLDSKPKDVGNITRIAIEEFKVHNDWAYASRVTHKIMGGMSAGNGTLMRILPIALAYEDPKQLVRMTRIVSEMTHYDKLATEACIIYNSIARRVMNGEILHDAIIAEIKGTRYKFSLRRNPSDRPNGYVVNTFEWVLRVLLMTDTYEDVVVRLANLGSDSDTTAAIAGGLAGLFYGLESIPDRLSSKIIRRNEILQLGADLFDLVNK